MPTYFFRIPSLQVCTVSFFGGGALVLGSGLWDLMRSRRNAVPVFNSTTVVKTEESARYPCEKIKGFDVVVRSFYVSVATDTDGHAPAPALSLLARFRRLSGLFSNETHRVDSADLTKTTAADQPVRLVARDAKDSDGGANTRLIAAAHWPPGTSKYAALILEPTPRTSDDSSAALPAQSRSLLRQFADGATHQSLSRCNPRSTLLHMACESDPAYLGAPYLRVLLSAFLLLPATLSQLNVAVLGVGGGSLPLFLQQYFAPRLHRCDLVDVEPMCIKAAVEQLGMKELLNTVALRCEGGGVHYYLEDAVDYLSHRVGDADCRTGCPLQAGSGRSAGSGEGASAAPHHGTPVFHDAVQPTPAAARATSAKRQRQLDLLFVDLFVGSELDTTVTSHEFLCLCRGSLSPHGVAAFNLPAADKRFVQRCNEVFGSRNVYRIPVPASSNEVVLARGGPKNSGAVADAPHLSHRLLFRRAQELSAHYRLPYDLANHYPVWWRLW
ncbi:conserved hypothetical protein [Leishmania infantum JPCM5]|uniref:Uncharacterized protein n=2 Tax=Leishmania infantum TaxID=5671 RepID=A4IAT5_LEIIN|nr:conserved hypothetical protein [Leishmania infantum JPCM5]CAC9542772.1 hypothetical_protein_-_conserved [Leishmania infantum]CAM71943.1 conserved hypothetical protein [Leishmania infantum JPCM5]SUZ45865.1 hypothetical_protein_-_conserved [Leishmania infantum]|eukprot:XP_001468854.1 conserved hypothetical protein [Leishmania infantum JPCM5]